MFKRVDILAKSGSAVCPYGVPSSNLVPRKTILWRTESGFLGFFSGFSRCSIFLPPTRSPFRSPTSCQIMFSFIHSSRIGIIVCFDKPPVYNHTVLGGEAKHGPHSVLIHYTPSLSKHCLGQNGSGVVYHHSSAQGPDCYWRFESWVLVAVVPR